MCTVMETCRSVVRLEDAISVTTHIKSEADYVRGYGNMWIYHASGRRYKSTKSKYHDI